MEEERPDVAGRTGAFVGFLHRTGFLSHAPLLAGLAQVFAIISANRHFCSILSGLSDLTLPSIGVSGIFLHILVDDSGWEIFFSFGFFLSFQAENF